VTALLAYLHEPETGALARAAILAGAALVLLTASRLLTPSRVVASGESAEIGAETPAVASLLTNGFVVTPYAATATLLDLVARGWLRIEQVDEDVVVLVDGRGTLDDALTSYEQQVLNHVYKLTAGTTNGITGAGIEVGGLRLPRRWSRRFNGSVIRQARKQRLCRRRVPLAALALPATLLGLAGWQWWRAVRDGMPTAVAESLLPRALAAGVAVVILALVRPLVGLARSQAQRPTALGRQRAEFWMSLRAWMEPRGFEHASSTAARNASRAVGYAAAFGLAERACDEVPVLPEDDRTAWSNATGRWHVVRIRYPFRPGYGRHPALVLAVGLVLGVGIVLLQRLLLDISKGHAFASIVDDFEEQADLIHDVAVGIAAALMVPLVWMAWLVVAGAFDLFATIERQGLVVRARRPLRVVRHRWLLGPLARRDRYSLFVAVDDGRSDRVGSWLANERTAVPQGARARVRATPLLGYIRSSEPIGTR
jgi:hypothetical protein